MPRVQVLIVDDHELFRQAARSFLESHPTVLVCGEAGDGMEAIEKVRQLRPDVVLMDINMPRMGGLEATRCILREAPACHVILVTQNDAAIAREQARTVGARGAVTKSDLARDLIPSISQLFVQDEPHPGKGYGEEALPAETPLPEGTLGKLVDGFAWEETPLGPMGSWPQSLKTVVRTMLRSRFPMWMSWGSELTFLYNDAYAKMTLGKKHPWALGKPSHLVWEEIWGDIGPRIRQVLATGQSTWDDALLLFLERSGYREETYHTFSYSPLSDDSGKIAGHLCVVTEETDRVIGERRLSTLRSLAAELNKTITEDDVIGSVARVLGENPQDLPFSLTYFFSADGRQARLGGLSGLPAGHPAAPETLDLSDPLPVWPLAGLAGGKDSQLVEELSAQFSSMPTGAWDISASRALLLPIASQTQGSPAGVLISGLNPYRPLDVSYTGFLNVAAGQIAASIANARAYEEEKKRAEALAEIDRAKTLFFGNVSHEFRTPLTLMLGPLEDMLAEADQLSPAQQKRLDIAHRNSLRLLKLVNTLLDFSRIEMGRFEASYEATDLAQLTADLAGVFRSAIERAGLKFILHCHPLSQPVYVDRESWEKIVFNLLSNALKFTFHGEIEVSLAPGGLGVELVVRDTGIGIPEKDLPNLFERFYRVKNAQGRTFEGTGIGLALVHELARVHGGDVRVESSLRQGSTFRVSLPFGKDHLPAEQLGAAGNASPAPLRPGAYGEEVFLESWLNENSRNEVSSANPETLAATSGRPHILLADDNSDMREYLGKLLAPMGEVRTAADGEAALRSIQEQAPDLVLSDIMMPRMDGFELLRRLREDKRTAAIPVILLSARAGEESRVQGLGAGADDYLIKPFAARELLARVRSQLNMVQLRREGLEMERRLRAEAELEGERLKELFAQAPVAIAVLAGPEHRLRFANQEFCRATGQQPDRELAGKPIREALREIADQGVFEQLDEVYRSGLPHTGYEERITIKRGPAGSLQEVFSNFVYQPLRDAAGMVEGIMVVAVDVTDKVLARTKVESTNNLLASIVDSSDDAILSKDRDGIITSWNKSAERMFGYPAQEAIGRHITLIVPGELRSEEEAIITQLRAGQPIDHLETVRQRKDGSHLEVALTVSPIRDSSGQVFGASTVVRDITERKALERAQRAFGEFTADLNRVQSMEDIYTAALKGICSAVRCERASILLCDGEGVMRFVSWRGLSDEYRQAVEGHSPWTPNDGEVQPICISDIDQAELDPTLKSKIRAEGIRALCFIPALANGKVIGKFMTYFAVPHEFSSFEVDFCKAIARQLGYVIEREKSRELLRSSEERFRQLSETLEAQVQARSQELEMRSAELLRQSMQLRDLSWRLLKSQDDERRHIARELHDSAGQTLTVLGMNVEQVLANVPPGDPGLSARLESIREMVQQLHREIRTTSYLLHPPLLDECGLPSAISFYVEGLAARSELKIELDIAQDVGRLPRDMELAVFRLVQECLTNIHRHSGSKTALIAMRREGHPIQLDIRDRGHGMSPQRLAEIQSGRSGVGIGGMRERLRQFEGTLNITSDASGTVISAVVPIPENASSNLLDPDSFSTAI
ncbi:MAG: response regulator [Acidobacteria bacterium]|nr:response regulator [Acidobacteriota bacterium]